MAHRRVADIVAALQMHFEHAVPVLVAHLVEHGIAQDARGIDDRVQAFERVQRLFDHARDAGPAGYTVGVGNGLAAGLFDLLHHLFGGAGRTFVAAGNAAAQIVHHHLGAFLGRQEGAFLADTVRRPGNENDLAFQHSHEITSVSNSCRSLASAGAA